MTLIEVLVASVVVVIGLLAIAHGLNAAQRGSTGAERSSVLAQAGEQALQAAEALPYSSLADHSKPAANATYYLSTCGVNTCYQWDHSNPASTETVDVDTVNGAVLLGPTTSVVPAPGGAGARIKYTVYEFVTTVKDSVCSQNDVFCPSASSYKRITVAVTNTSPGPPYTPVYVSSFVSDKAGGAANPLTQPGTQCADGGATVPCVH